MLGLVRFAAGIEGELGFVLFFIFLVALKEPDNCEEACIAGRRLDPGEV